jgi:alpha-tubulin suppressor-like RCC1 family protein
VLLTTGGLSCWGRNSSGQLGNGSTTDRHTPVGVSGLTSGVTHMDCGMGHACAATTAGEVKCWGGNSSGQLGIGTTSTYETTPQDVTISCI